MFVVLYSLSEMSRTESRWSHQKNHIRKRDCFFVGIETNETVCFGYVHFIFKPVCQDIIALIQSIIKFVCQGNDFYILVRAESLNSRPGSASPASCLLNFHRIILYVF